MARIHHVSCDDQLQQQVKKFWELDHGLGIKHAEDIGESRKDGKVYNEVNSQAC